MEEISKLIQEAKPLYFARKKRRRILTSVGAVMCCCLIVFTATIKQNTPIYDFWEQEVYSASNGSIIEDMGLPVDEYGLLWIG
jgi:hypothetical protein